MATPTRAFLSHSSKDKNLVGPVFKNLTAAHAHFDEATFEKGETSASEIYKAISNTELFVLFLSKNSVNSQWVQTELVLAQQKIYSGKIKKILVFLLDSVDHSEVPEWLLAYVYRKTSTPGIITTAIRSALFDIAMVENSTLSIFMGRDKEISVLKESLSSLSADSPQAIFLAGNDGIGRRTLAKRALQDVHPQLIKLPIEIVLRDADSDIEFYRALLNQGEHLTILQSVNKIEKFTSLNLAERTAFLVDLIEKISSQRQIIVLRGKDSLVREDGGFAEWINLILSNLTPSPWPKLAIIARRMIPATKRRNHTNVAFFPINSLDENSSKRLLSIWLKHYQADIDSALVDEISEYVTGHPRNIQIAAALAAEYGSARLKTQRPDFLEAIRQQARSLIEGINFNADQENILALFREYEYLSAEDIFVAIGTVDETELSKTLSYLTDHGILENEGPYIRMAPYLLDTLSRYNWSESTRKFIIDCRDRLLDRVNNISIDDYASISTIDAWVLSSLRQEKNMENIILTRCLLPSHLLRVSREFYDRKDFSRTIELAQKALHGSNKLSSEAQVESLRLICLSSVRLGQDNTLHLSLDKLTAHGNKSALRTAAFIRGFKARYDGNIDIAEREYRQAFELDGKKNFHILRELAQILKIKEEFQEAEEFSRAAQNIAGRNPFILDTLLEIIIERNKDNQKFLRDDKELKELFDVLKEAAHREQRSFYESRLAHYYSCLHDPSEAEKWALEAEKITPSHVPVLLTLAKIQINSNNTFEADKTLNKVQKIIIGAGKNADRRNVAEMDKLKILLLTQSGDFSSARTELQRARALPHKIQESLMKKIDIAEAYQAK